MVLSLLTPNRIKVVLAAVMVINVFYIGSLFLSAPLKPPPPPVIAKPHVIVQQTTPAVKVATATPTEVAPQDIRRPRTKQASQLEETPPASLATTPPPPPPATATAVVNTGKSGANPGTQGSSDIPFLILGMPTIPRKGDKGTRKYLTRAIQAVADQLPTNDANPDHEVILMVMNNRPGQHPEWDECKKKWMSSDKSRWFRFVENPRIYKDPHPEIPEPRPNPHDQPGPQVRQQTLDVAGLLDAAANKCQHFQVIEDDVKLCPRALEAIIYAVNKANRYQEGHLEWTGLRMSYGMNGITLKGHDLTNFREFLILNLFLVPPDLLIIEWWAGKHGSEPYVGKRPFMQYKYNIYEHLGSLSSFEGRGERRTPSCYAEYTNMLWPIEQFHSVCGNDDINPCENRKEPLKVIRFDK